VAYDERLAARIRALLADRADVSERKMFGGLTFMVSGNMCCGVNGDELGRSSSAARTRRRGR
jgi:TfoX/Sxy family transcriptional regulator of competence genes